MLPEMMPYLLLHIQACAAQLLQYSLIACSMCAPSFEGLNYPYAAKPGSSGASQATTKNFGHHPAGTGLSNCTLLSS